MPLSEDNQDFGQNDKADKSDMKEKAPEGDKKTFTTDDLKGKKVDGDPEEESDKPIKQS